jgi:hemolysin D
MAQLPSFSRKPAADLLAAPISAFESETLAVMQATAPAVQHVVLYVLAGLVALSLILMSVVKLDKVVSGAGKILPSQGALFVQPLDRAIVSGILVRTGDVVRKGQVLAMLDPTFASADLHALQEKQASSKALVERLTAERDGRPYVADPASPFSQIQANIWRQRQDEHQQGRNDYDSRIRSLESAVSRNQQDAEGYGQRLALAQEREKTQSTLRAQGYSSRTTELAVTDNRLEVERLMKESENGLAGARHDLVALQAQRAVYESKWRDDLNTQLVQAKNDLAEAVQGLDKARKVSDLSRLTAPEDAVVLKVGAASIGSMVDPQSTNVEPLFTLTPLSGPVEAEVHVQARDVGFIRPGDKVRIKLDAFNFTQHGTADGVVKTISDGSFTETENGQPTDPYFKVRVLFTRVQLRNVPSSFRLIPGMTLTGDMLVGKRTIMTYLIGGALRTGSEAMREPG